MGLNELFEAAEQVSIAEVLDQYQQEKDPLKKEFLRALCNYQLGISQRRVLEEEKY